MNFKKYKDEDVIVRHNQGMYGETYDKLKPGLYTLKDQGGMFTGPMPGYAPVSILNGLTQFTDSPIINGFMKDVGYFLTDKVRDEYKTMKINHQIAYILYGKPGTGKTSLAMLTMLQIAAEHNTICLDCTSVHINFAIHAIKEIREVQDNPIVLFFDEIDQDFNSHETVFLKFLDGTLSAPNIILIGCTNDLNNIPDRIKNRRSRVKKCIEITSLPYKVYYEYAKERLVGVEEDLLKEFSYKAAEKGVTIDQFKNTLIDYKIYSIPFDTALEENLLIFHDPSTGDDDK